MGTLASFQGVPTSSISLTVCKYSICIL